jgi:LacI family transcriptional regulator
MTKIPHSVTRDEVAKDANVSAATVSYVVNNGPRPVAPETRNKVLASIQKLGYRPNAVARNLRMQHTSTIGLIIPDTYNPFFAEVARGVEQIAFENNMTVVLCHSDYKLDRELQYIEVLQAERAAGVIWFPATNSTEPAIRVSSYGMPLVVLDRILAGVRAPFVVADNFLGGYLATKHLIELGHRVIACITRPMAQSHSSERIRGYRQALIDHNIPYSEALLINGGLRLEEGRDAGLEVLKHPLKPTAIFAYNDFMAIGAMRAIHEKSIPIPRSISLVGFDDIPLAAFTFPALTTVSQPKLEMGRQGAALLLDIMDGRTISLKDNAPLPVKLVVRESTGKCV